MSQSTAIESGRIKELVRHFLRLGMGGFRFGGLLIFFNAINLTDVRQTRFDPLIRPTPGPGGNPITEVWAPLEGRSFNVGVHAEL